VIHFYTRSVLAAALALPVLVAAQPEPQSAANPTERVPAVAYRSVFADTPAGVEQETTDWRQANLETARFQRGHVDILKWEGQQAAAAPAPAPASPKPMPPHGPMHGAKP
jgi:hypothetical protein